MSADYAGVANKQAQFSLQAHRGFQPNEPMNLLSSMIISFFILTVLILYKMYWKSHIMVASWWFQDGF